MWMLRPHEPPPRRHTCHALTRAGRDDTLRDGPISHPSCSPCLIASTDAATDNREKEGGAQAAADEGEEEGEEAEECNICLERMSASETVMLRCGHTFHKGCSSQSESVEMRDTGRWKCPRCRALISFIRIRGGKAGHEKTLIDAVPGGAQQHSVSYLLCRSAGAREVVAGLVQVDSVGNVGKGSAIGSTGGDSTYSDQCPCPATTGGADITVASAGAGGAAVNARMGPGVLKRQLSVRGGDVSKVGSMVILDVDVSLLRDDEITLWQSEGDLLRSSPPPSLSLSLSLSFSLSLSPSLSLALSLSRARSLFLAFALARSLARALSFHLLGCP